MRNFEQLEQDYTKWKVEKDKKVRQLMAARPELPEKEARSLMTTYLADQACGQLVLTGRLRVREDC